jgi:hypothetical protein
MINCVFPSDRAITVNFKFGQVLTLYVKALSAQLKTAAIETHKAHLISVGFACIAGMNVIYDFIVFFKVTIIQCSLPLLIYFVQGCSDILKVNSGVTDVKRDGFLI